MKRILPILCTLALITACSPKSPSADFPEGKWGLSSFTGQVQQVFTFNTDHTMADPQNNPGTWSLNGNHLSVDVKITTKEMSFKYNDPNPIYTPVTSTKHQDLTIVSKTPDTVTITDTDGNAGTFKYLPPVSP